MRSPVSGSTVIGEELGWLSSLHNLKVSKAENSWKSSQMVSENLGKMKEILREITHRKSSGNSWESLWKIKVEFRESSGELIEKT